MDNMRGVVPGKRTIWVSASICLVVLLLGSIVFRTKIVEWFWLWKFNRGDSTEQYEAVEALANIARPSAIEPLLQGMARRFDPRDCPICNGVLHGPDYWRTDSAFRSNVSIIFGITKIDEKFGSVLVQAAFTRGMTDNDPHVRAASLVLQATYIPTRSEQLQVTMDGTLSAIIGALNDPNPHVRVMASRTLRIIQHLEDPTQQTMKASKASEGQVPSKK
jgi:hypothetical protein